MTVRLDFTTHTIVCICDECQWRHLTVGCRLDAWTAAAHHEAEAHPTLRQARLALIKAEHAQQR